MKKKTVAINAFEETQHYFFLKIEASRLGIN